MTRAPAAVVEPPVWLLDVDEVINADRQPWGEQPYNRTLYVEREYKLRWSPTLMKRIRRLRAAGAVDLRWCTTWCPHAHLLERTWGLPPLPRALTDKQCAGSPGRVDAAKCEAAQAVLDTGARLIWTDDTAVPAFGPMRESMLATGRALLIRPQRKIGLTPAHMAEIEAFAGHQSASA